MKYRIRWWIENGTPVSPNGAASATVSALTITPGGACKLPPCRTFDLDSEVASLNGSASAYAYVDPTAISGCSGTVLGNPGFASGSASAQVNDAGGSSAIEVYSFVGTFAERATYPRFPDACIVTSFNIGLDLASASTSSNWQAESIVPVDPTLPIMLVYCIEEGEAGADGFVCSNGNTSGLPGGPSSPTRSMGLETKFSLSGSASIDRYGVRRDSTTGGPTSSGNVDLSFISAGCGATTQSMIIAQPGETLGPINLSLSVRHSNADGDMNGDTLVDCSDKPAFIAAMNTVASDVAYDIRADLDLDGDVDVQDLVAFIAKVPCCNFGCNPADIACDDGTPLLFNPGCANSNDGPNEGDYNAFFSAIGFFYQSSQGAAAIGSFCDIACDDGTPLCESPNCANSGVNEGDYNAFFNTFFTTCSSS